MNYADKDKFDRLVLRVCALEGRSPYGRNPDVEEVKGNNRRAAAREYEEASDRYWWVFSLGKPEEGYSQAEIAEIKRHMCELELRAKRLGAL